MNPSYPTAEQSSASTAEPDSPAGGQTRLWWERFFPLFVLLLLLSIVGFYLAPSYPDWALLLLGLIIVVDAALWYVAWQVGGILKTSKYRSIRFTRNDRPVTVQKRRFVLRLIGASATATLFSVVQAFLFGLRGDYDAAVRFVLPYLVLAFLFATIFAAMWPGRMARAERLLDSTTGYWIAVLASVVVAASIGYLSIFALPGRLDQGPPASWPTLLRFAQHEADRLGQSAVVESVMASTPYYARHPLSSGATALTAAFVFRRPSLSSTRVEVLDTDPPRLVKVYGAWDFMASSDGTSSSMADLLSHYSANLAYIKLSAQDAYRLTEKEGLEFAAQVAPGQTPSVDISLFMDHDWQKRFGVPSGWYVDYTVSAKGTYKLLSFQVDGASGKILGRAREPDVSEATPLPSVTGVAATPVLTGVPPATPTP